MTQDWQSMADKAMANGDHCLAEEGYTHAIKQAEAIADPMCYKLFANRSEAKYRMENYASALEDAERSIYLKPSFGTGHLRIGYALEALKKYRTAYEAYKTGLVHDATNQALLQAKSRLAQLIERLDSEKEAPDNELVSPNVKVFLEWLREKGAKFPKVEIYEYGDEYRGVVARGLIHGDEVVISVPRNLMITSENAIQSQIGHAIIQSGVEVKSRHSFLAAFLLQERARPQSDPSPWAPYLNVLPQRFDTIPLNFSREELSYLKGSMAIGKIEARIELLKSEYNRIASAVPSFAQFSYEEFAWARCIVITRIFGVTVDGRKTEALVPLADFLNHKRPRETIWLYEPISSCFNISALGTINNGMQITDSYGRKCNSRFFTNYGFSVEDNDDNEAVIRFSLDSDDPLLYRKALLLREEEPMTEKVFSIPATIGKDSPISEVLGFLRLACANVNEFDRICEAIISSSKKIERLNRRNEQAALRLLKSACLSALSEFETSFEDDQRLLKDSSLTVNVRNCIIMRMGEKKVLNFFIEFVDDMIPLLSLSKADMDWVLCRCQERHFTGAFDQYISSVVLPLVMNET